MVQKGLSRSSLVHHYNETVLSCLTLRMPSEFGGEFMF